MIIGGNAATHLLIKIQNTVGGLWPTTPYSQALHPVTLTPVLFLPQPHSLRSTLNRTPYSLHPTPYTLHPTPYTLHPTPYTLHPTPYTLHPTPYTLHPKPWTPMNTKHSTLNPVHVTP